MVAKMRVMLAVQLGAIGQTKGDRVLLQCRPGWLQRLLEEIPCKPRPEWRYLSQGQG